MLITPPRDCFGVPMDRDELGLLAKTGWGGVPPKEVEYVTADMRLTLSSRERIWVR